MDTQNFQKSEVRSTQNQTHIRFTDREFRTVAHEAAVHGVSIPQLLKDVFFKRTPTQVLMAHEDRVQWVVQILRMWTDINQIAKRMKAGVATDAKKDLNDISRKLDAIVAAVVPRPQET